MNIDNEKEELLNFVRRCATGKRPDGTYNYCREALEQQANELLNKQFGDIAFTKEREINRGE